MNAGNYEGCLIETVPSKICKKWKKIAKKYANHCVGFIGKVCIGKI